MTFPPRLAFFALLCFADHSTLLADANVPAPKEHWAFRPVGNPAPAAVKPRHLSAIHNDIDRFIVARLEAKGLSPSAPADARTLIRRVTVDLTGLPPTPDDIESFLKDYAARGRAAYETLVDRLLASPHYGENWGRHWLDVARYADTKGYVFFQDAAFPWGWTYRDYVIEALNKDLPYDRFVLEQLAADLLPPGGDKKPLRALGFLTLGGRFMNNQHDIIDDRIDVVSRGLLGLTVTCARCHDHKFDPIPTKDYYSLYAVFAACDEPEVPPLYETPPKTPEYQKFAKELAAREGRLRDFLDHKRADLVKGAIERAGEYLIAAHNLRGKPRTDEFMLLADGNDLNPKMIVRYQAFLERTGKGDQRVFGPWHALAEPGDDDFAVRARGVIDGLKAADTNPVIADALALRRPASMADVAAVYGSALSFAERQGRQNELLMAVVGGASSPLVPPAVAELRQVFHGSAAPANVGPTDFSELELLPDRPAQAELQKFRKEVEQWRASGAGAPPRAMVLYDLPVRPTQRVFLRGSPTNLGEPVRRQFLGVLAGKDRKPFAHGSGRLELAKAIVDPNNPLTARVMVNRVWGHYFGRGLVATPSDFGLRSEPPTHPELLDYLARTFMADGWSLKKLHRRIVLSGTYQQQCRDRAESLKVDPENTLLWRKNRRRLTFEETRDALLVVAGRLDPKIGGPSVANFLAPGANRRTMYGHLDRLNVPGVFRTFDFPSPDATCPQRDLTTTPPQALFMMNHRFVAECAKNLLKRKEVGGEMDLGKRVKGVYHVLYGRAARSTELELARTFLGPLDEQAWQRYVHALLQTNEFVFVD